MITGSDIFLDTNILVHYTFKDFEPTKHNECRISDFQEIKTIDPAELLKELYPSFDPGE